MAAAAALLLAGCQPGDFSGFSSRQAQSTPLPTTATKMPRYSDALAGLYAAPSSKLPRDVPIDYYAPGGASGKPGRAVLTMALVPGANYTKTRDYLAQASSDIAKSAPSSGGTAQSDLQLKPVMKQAVDIVKQRYPWIELTDDLAAAQKHNTSLTLVLDIRTRLASKSGGTTAVQIEVIAFNDQHKPIAHFVSEGRANAGGENGYNFKAAADQALSTLQQKSTSYFN